MAILVIILARQIGAFVKKSTTAQTAIMMGIAVKTMFLYSFKVASARSNSEVIYPKPKWFGKIRAQLMLFAARRKT